MTGHQTSNLVEGRATRAGLARTDETNGGSAPPTPPVRVSEVLVPLPDELSFEEGAAVSCGTDTA